MKIVLCTGGYDPLHSGHIAYFNAAKQLADYLIVGVNSDHWLERKKGQAFMPWEERAEIVRNLKAVDEVIEFDDYDGTACDAIQRVKDLVPNAHVIFANGGDRTADNIPEMKFSDVTFEFSIGGDNKKNSSSWILKNWSQPTTTRQWGKYTVLDSGAGWKAKQLEIDPLKSLSDQKHSCRSEHWHIVEGSVKVALEHECGDITIKTYQAGSSIDIPANTWHKATNVGDIPAKVIEVWLGHTLTEDDIERRD